MVPAFPPRRPAGLAGSAKKGGPFGPPRKLGLHTQLVLFGAANYKRKFVINLECYTFVQRVYGAGVSAMQWYGKHTTPHGLHTY